MGENSGSELFENTSPITTAIGKEEARKRIQSGNKILIDAQTESARLRDQKLLGEQRKRQKLLRRLIGQ